MKLLGIDYGRKKIGLATSDGPLAEPLSVIKYGSIEEVLKKVEKVVKVEKVEKIIVGVSEGKMAEETRKFGKKLEGNLKIPVIFQDETLTTQEAQSLSKQAGINRKKRKGMEDAYAAALILQNYLDLLKD